MGAGYSQAARVACPVAAVGRIGVFGAHGRPGSLMFAAEPSAAVRGVD
jgi:hypothetical protein